MDVHRAAFGVDVSPCQGERFGDACAGADEQFGERSVVRRAGVEVAVDFGEAEEVKPRRSIGSGATNWQGFRGSKPRRLASPRTPESAALALLIVLAEIDLAC